MHLSDRIYDHLGKGFEDDALHEFIRALAQRPELRSVGFWKQRNSSLRVG